MRRLRQPNSTECCFTSRSQDVFSRRMTAAMPESLVSMLSYQGLTSMELLTLRCLFARPSYNKFGARLPSPSASLKILTSSSAQTVGYIVRFPDFQVVVNGIPFASTLFIFLYLLHLPGPPLQSVIHGIMQLELVKPRIRAPQVHGVCNCGISCLLQPILMNSSPPLRHA